MKIGKEKGVSIAPELIGLFFEDINFAADGGLYAELIENLWQSGQILCSG